MTGNFKDFVRQFTCQCGEVYRHAGKDVLLVNINKLKKDSYLDINVSEDTIRVASLYVQDTIIEKVTGSCLFNRLRDLYCDGKMDDPPNWCYKELVDDYLFPVFVYSVQAETSIPLSYKNRNNGTIQANTDTTTQSQLGDIKYLNQYYANKSDFYVKRAIDYLRCHKKCFPELCCPSCCGLNEKPMSKGPTTPLNLNITRPKTRRRL